MASISSAGEAVARIAYLSSDLVLSVQPSLTSDSEFSPTLKTLASAQTPNTLSDAPPEVQALRQNADPLLSVYEPARRGRLVSVTTGSAILIPSIPHLYKLAELPIVIHVSLQSAEYADITSIRQCGFTFLQSESLQEIQDLAITAHALALKSGKGVIHFFDSEKTTGPGTIARENGQIVKQLLGFSDVQSRRVFHEASGDIYLKNSGIPDTDVARREQNSSANTVSPNEISPTRSSGENSSSHGSGKGDQSPDQTPATSVSSLEPTLPKTVTSEDILGFASSTWQQLEALTGRHYEPFLYTGPADAKAAVFVFGTDANLFVKQINAASQKDIYESCGVATVRLYRPWLGSVLSNALPKSLQRIAVVEPSRRKATKWGPLLMDLLTTIHSSSSSGQRPTIVGYQLGTLSPSTIHQALNGIFSNLLSKSPIQNLEVGGPLEDLAQHTASLQQPQVENAYLKVLSQVFGERLYLANRLGAKDAGTASALSSNPEFGFGSLLARMEKKMDFISDVQRAAKSSDFVTDVPKQWLSRWALASGDPPAADKLAPEVLGRLANDGSTAAYKLLQSRELFYSESRWLIGSDAWAYDLGNSGVHHLLASGKNINMLIIDSQPYSERVAADANRRKKDIGLYAMNFGNAYVASTAVYSSYTQVLEAMIEADKFNGPSIVLAYLPYEREDDSPLTVLQETKKAVDLGYWPLYRWQPGSTSDSEPKFSLDSERIKKELEDFLRRDNQLTQLMNRNPEFSNNLAGSYGYEVRHAQRRKAKDAYSKLLEGLYGAPLTILFASDNGNAENLSKRMANRAKARGLKAMAMAMDDYPLEDLAKEENVVFVTSTAGQGEFPQNGRAFWEGVKNATDLDLAGVRYAVFALGDSHYWPRKEDKIYYNKPGKDLNTRLLALGGKQLVDVGLGDDQDPDTYQTGYGEWEPKLWQALGVDNVEGIPEEPPPLTNEDIKAASNFLRGTISEGLQDQSTGCISPSDAQLTKFHGTYQQDDRDLRDERKAQGLEPAYSFMIRCRLPGGVATPSQWIQMDDISTNLGNQTMKLTTRQTFQFHGVVKSKLRSAMQSINKALMTTLAACGDVNRNVMCSSLPQHSQYHADVHAVSKRISDHLLPSTSAYHEIWLKDENDKQTQIAGNAVVDQEPLYGPVYLPRKFKITIAIPPHNDTDVYAHDIGLIAIKDASTNRLQGFNLLAGGGMGVTHNNKKTYPRTGSMLGYVDAEKVHIACEKVMLVQRDHGDRKNRKHARLKYTMDDMGPDVFKSKVEEAWGEKFGAPQPFHFDSNIDTFGWQTDESGRHHFTMFIENGRIEDTADFKMKTGLREIAKVHKGEFRLTGNQHLILSDVSGEQLPVMKDLLSKYKLDNTAQSGLRLSSSACVAFPTCGLAMAESERYLPELITKLEGAIEESGLRQESIVMRMTGCPNGCARPWVAEVAFVGKAYGAYNMYLGGGYHGQRLNKLYRSSIMEDEILEIMRGFIKRYAIERNEGEHFGDWCIRSGIINETTEGKYFHENTAEIEEEDE